MFKQGRQAHHCRQGAPETIIKVSNLNVEEKARIHKAIGHFGFKGYAQFWRKLFEYKERIPKTNRIFLSFL
jgi:hypothetical protein